MRSQTTSHIPTSWKESIEDKLNQIVQKIYGGKRVVLTANAQKQAKQLEDSGLRQLPDLCGKDTVQPDR